MTTRASLRRALRHVRGIVLAQGADYVFHKRVYHDGRAHALRAFIESTQSTTGLFVDNACPACGRAEGSSKSFENRVGFRFVTCPVDGTVYMDPVPSEEALGALYNHPSESYSFTRGAATNELRVVARDQAEHDAILRLMGPDSGRRRMLDVGCATGGFLITCRSSFDVQGVELNDTTAEIARRQGFDVLTGRLNDVPGEATFGLITMLQLIEHVVKPSELLADAFRLLEPGGLLYINTPNVDSASFRYLGRYHTHVSGFGHVSLFTRQALGMLAERAGFELLAHEYCGGRDLALHDLVTFKLARSRFAHRMALYNVRLLSLSKLVEELGGALIPERLWPIGHESYQRVLLRRPTRRNSPGPH